MSRRRVGVIVGSGIGALLVAAVITGAVLQPWSTEPALPEAEPLTVAAERTTLTSDLVLNGSLSYGDAIELPGRPGIITRLPSAGDEIGVGQGIVEVDGRPVIAVLGERPFWRALGRGIDDGADVQQLEEFLAAAGFGEEMTVDTAFTWTTEQAVEAWQRSLGLPETGVVELGEIVAVPTATVRIRSVTAAIGESAGASPLTYTSTRLRVVVKLTDGQAREILPDTVVAITLPDGATTPGRITAIDPGGEPTGKDGETTPATATVELDDPAVAAGIGLRAVKVTLASESVDDALVVPVTALVALLEGGYAVDVVDGRTTRRVVVELGLIADTRVQVVAGDLAEGDLVVVAG